MMPSTTARRRCCRGVRRGKHLFTRFGGWHNHRHNPSLNINFADAFLCANCFHLIPNFVCECDAGRDCFDENKRGGSIRCIHLYVLNSDHARQKRLPRLDIFYAVQFQCVGDLAEYPVANFQPLGRKFINFVFRLEITSQGKKYRDNQKQKDVRAKRRHFRRRAVPGHDKQDQDNSGRDDG
jgi:hypothetical protein